MSGYTENKILILKDFDYVFDLTNQIEAWPKLFTEYQSSEVLEKTDDEILFRLTTFASEDRPSRTWISKRWPKKQEGIVTAQRLSPTFPFAHMNIRWEYERLPSDQSVLMTWVQEFEVHPECKFSTTEMESFLNRNTREQMRAVKKAVENWGM